MGFITDNLRRVMGDEWVAEQQAANRGGFGNTLKRIGSAAPKVAALAAIPATLGASGAVAGGAGAGAAKAAGGLGGAISGGLKSIPGIGGVLSKGADWLGAHKDTLLPLLGAAEGVYGGVREEQLRRRALGSAEGSYNERAPLRAMGLRGLQNTTRPDLSEIFANPADPYKPTLKRLTAGSY